MFSYLLKNLYLTSHVWIYFDFRVSRPNICVLTSLFKIFAIKLLLVGVTIPAHTHTLFSISSVIIQKSKLSNPPIIFILQPRLFFIFLKHFFSFFLIFFSIHINTHVHLEQLHKYIQNRNKISKKWYTQKLKNCLVYLGNNRLNKKKKKGDVSSKSMESFIIVVVMSCRG